ncbi:MAG: glycosyltransferase, partial [Urechidicola sp.]|nr:glycosyltransferase [Urechidicola sp.]
GGDGDVDKLKDIIKTNSLENIVSYIGWVSGDLKKELFEKCNIMILPSYNEGLPISLLEAMSYSMPIISTNVGGIPQVLEDRVNGKMVTPGNKQQIGDAITYYINNNEQIEIHGKISYNKVQDFFPKQVLKKLKLIFDSIS